MFYPDLTILGCSNPQIKQIAYQFLLSVLILVISSFVKGGLELSQLITYYYYLEHKGMLSVNG